MGIDEVMVAVLFFLFLGGGAIVLLVLTIANTVLVARQERRLKALEARLAGAGIPGAIPTPAPIRTSLPERLVSPPTAPRPETAPASIPLSSAPPPRAGSTDSLETRIGSGCLARIGVLAVIIGMGFFLKLAIDYGWVGPGERVLIGLATGILFLGLGWRLIRRAYVATGIALTGGGLGILYFSLYAAFAFYTLIGQLPAFLFMILVTAIAVALAIKFDSRLIAGFGLLGGFLTPVLLSTGTNAFVSLCAYILMLDLAFLALARFKDWKWLNTAAWLGAALLLAAWADDHYTRDQFLRTLSWFTVFFGLFWLIAILPRIVRKDPRAGSLFLMTTNSLVYFAVGAAMIEQDNSLWTGAFTLGVAAIHILMAAVATRLAPSDRVLSFLTTGLAIFFLTMVFPMQYDDDPVILAWIVEAVILMAVGARVRRLEFRAGAWIMLLVAAARLLAYGSAITLDDPPAFTLILNRRFGLILLFILAAFSIGALLKRFRDSIRPFEFRGGRLALLVLANLFALWGLTTETLDHFELARRTTPEIARSTEAYERSAQESERLWEIRSRLSGEVLSPEERSALEVERVIAEEREAALMAESQTLHEESRLAQRRIDYARSTTLSILWALYSILMIAVGIATRSGAARLMALVVFGVTILKVFLHDLAGLETIYRVVSFIGLGVLLIAVSLIYTRFRTRINDFVLSRDDR